MTAIALFGAGGKMGYRLAANLKGSRFDVRHVEPSDAGRERLRELDFTAVDPAKALDGAEVVILAVPDTMIGKVAAGIAPSLKPGTMVVVLDAAAPFAGHLPKRPTSPISSPTRAIRRSSTTRRRCDAKTDYFGGIAAKQHIVSALMQGPESAYALGEEIAKVIWAPVMRSHRVTVEQMALLEPGLSRDGLRHAARRHEGGDGRRGGARRAARGRARLPARPPQRPGVGDLRGRARACSRTPATRPSSSASRR